MKRITAVLCLIICTSMLFLTSCSRTHTLEYKDGTLVDKSAKITYTPLPLGFEPCGVGELFGEYGDGAFSLYAVCDLDKKPLDTAEWLTEAYSGSATAMFYGDGITFPALEDISFDVAYICREDSNVISVASIDDASLLKELISAFDKKENTALWPRGTSDTVYENLTIKFYSAEYPAFFYSVNYSITSSGNYIHKSGESDCINIEGMLDGYYDSSEYAES